MWGWAGTGEGERGQCFSQGTPAAAALVRGGRFEINPGVAEGYSGVVMAGQLEQQAPFILQPLCWD